MKLTIAKFRKKFRKSKERLHRARWLYVVFAKNSITDYKTLRGVAEKMKLHGLYSHTIATGDVMSLILCKLCRIETGGVGDWNEWLMKTGWRPVWQRALTGA